MEAFATRNLSPGDALSVARLDRRRGSSGSLPHYLEASETFPYLAGEASPVTCTSAAAGPPSTTRTATHPSRPRRSSSRSATTAMSAPSQRRRPPRPARAGSASTATRSALPTSSGSSRRRETRRSKALSQPRARAAAWAGGRLVVWTRGRRSAITMALVERRGARPRALRVDARVGEGGRQARVRDHLRRTGRPRRTCAPRGGRAAPASSPRTPRA